MKKGLAIHVRQLRNLTSEQVWSLKGRYEVTFDDNVTLPMGGRHIKLSWPYWAFSRLYDFVPTPSTLAYHRDEISTDNKHLELLSMMFVLAKHHGIPIADIRYVLSEHGYTDAYNNSVDNLIEYLTTVDIDTFRDIWRHPRMDEVRRLAERYPEGYDEDGKDMVEEAYQHIEAIFDDPAMRYNAAVMSVKDKTIKGDQILQAFVRGKTSEIDSRVFSNQVWTGFFTGLDDIGRVKESCSTSRSHLYNTDNIADAEYTSRKFQLVANVLMNFTRGDCGSNHYHRHTFTDTMSSETTFNAMVGMFYQLEGHQNGIWIRFNHGDFKKLVNKPLIYRSAMTCKLLSKQSICSICMGELIDNLSDDTSPAHLASTSISEKGSQGILSTKHLDFLRKVLTLIFTTDMQRYITLFKHSTVKAVRLQAKPLSGSWDEYELSIQDKIHSELIQIGYHGTLSELDETALPDINTLTFSRVDKDKNIIDEESINVRMGVCGNFSQEFLKHYLRNKDNLRIEGKSVFIPLAGWNVNRPLLVYTNRSESMAEFVSAMEAKIRSASVDGEDRLVKSRKMEGNQRSTFVKNKNGVVKSISLVEMRGATEKQCTDAMLDMHMFVERKLKGIPMTHIAMMLAVTRVESPTNSFPAVGFDAEDYNQQSGKRFLDHNTIMGRRSAAPMLFYEGQQDYLDNIGFWTDRIRPASLYDGAFATVKK
ncbi:putative DNA-directed RNA polymerase beta subunit [Erwinia phage vB_EamM_Phobos]|uniref:RNA polymerase beta subunit n=1 Tax=Erwinia phage vB_EamM_Phobos TaxID=1883377 RepID=UPI00081D137F|nr:RNA polymerase beta subunit [Erwinia phage vB_EamM_Phobos]ANZ50227.1 putative DNA-directed RNA polymerase beta subunit [Erwinia phage vB_EamM_Phobos]